MSKEKAFIEKDGFQFATGMLCETLIPGAEIRGTESFEIGRTVAKCIPDGPTKLLTTGTATIIAVADMLNLQRDPDSDPWAYVG